MCVCHGLLHTYIIKIIKSICVSNMLLELESCLIYQELSTSTMTQDICPELWSQSIAMVGFNQWWLKSYLDLSVIGKILVDSIKLYPIGWHWLTQSNYIVAFPTQKSVEIVWRPLQNLASASQVAFFWAPGKRGGKAKMGCLAIPKTEWTYLKYIQLYLGSYIYDTCIHVPRTPFQCK